MNCLQISKYTEDLNNVEYKKVKALTKDDLASGQVLIKVFASSVNPIDWKITKGHIEIIVKLKNGRKMIPGFDFSGKIIAVGKDCKLKVGDEVFGMAHFKKLGAFSELMISDEKFLSYKPKNLSFKESAVLPLVCQTSLQSLKLVKLKQGESILIIGASSGTGSAGIQLSKFAFGAKNIVGVCSSKNIEYVKSIGATQVIDYKKDNWWEVLKGKDFDVVYDCVGGYDSWKNCAQILKTNGRYVTICGDTPGSVTVKRILKTSTSKANRKFWSWFKYPAYYHLVCASNSDDLRILAKLAEDGKLKIRLDKVFPLSEGRKALEYNKTRRAVGKVCIICSDEKEDEENKDEEKKEDDEDQEGEKDDQEESKDGDQEGEKEEDKGEKED